MHGLDLFGIEAANMGGEISMKILQGIVMQDKKDMVVCKFLTLEISNAESF